MELKIALILTLTSMFLGFIIALTIFSAIWALMFIPHVVFSFCLVQHMFKEEKKAKKLLDKYSTFSIEQRVSYQNKPEVNWDVVFEKIDTLKESDNRLEILIKDFNPEKDEKYGNPVFVDWRIVQNIQGTEIYDKAFREIPLPVEAKLQQALDTLDKTINRL